MGDRQIDPDVLLCSRRFRKERSNAWTRRSDESYVQLPLARAARARGPSAASDSRDDRPSVRHAVAAVHEDVFGDGPPIDSARAVAAGAAAPIALHGAQ